MSIYKGPTAYNNEDFMNTYLKRRHRKESPNNIIEKPALIKLLGDVRGKEVMDLGCGESAFGLELLESGCESYLGIEGSERMYEKALETLKGTSGNVQHATLESFAYPENTFDIVLSRLVFHYIEDLSPIIENIYGSLKQGGRFIFSVQHPLLTSSVDSNRIEEQRTDRVVDDYFYSGERIEQWMGERVVKYHRTVEDYFKLLKRAGFSIEDIQEPKPNKKYFSDLQEYRRRMRIPLFLLFSCSK
ncbi:class I SAM-dependent methyltransferase [Aquibacillus koreensis]|uniref:Class I SAM-dependent methyltransferase n=1 Tax=Aquibacillus koreensis TaxID=279446 RepID=A0A9X4AJE8_9BACI|nr:class I SAM-dependent methyltransferase [Aquibacillus koreensis]MCT2534939.1 class I SAM-dependent methyltransferase [Aquibacillus koreensis]MDC3422167.1 class I SAM-dependent methyltransferase [Aquibacillus koreensis]